MALDEALLESVQNGAPPILRFYRWSPACLSFGRNQTARGSYDPDALTAAGIDVVRRPTGGLAVLHDDELTYAVIAPAVMLGGPRAAYATINHAIVAGLKLLGVSASIAGNDGRVAGPESDHPCFHTPAPGEVLAAGGKLVGSAQRCEKRVILQHGSILIGGSQSVMRSFQFETNASRAATGHRSRVEDMEGVDAETQDGVTLAGVLGNAPAPELVATAIASGFEATLGTRLAPCGMTKAERERAVSIQKRYDSNDWTWRR